MPASLEVQAHSPVHRAQSPPVTSPIGSLTEDQREKLQSELDIVESNMAVLGEMLSEMQPGNEQPDELELLQVIKILLTFQIVLKSKM